VRLAALLGLAVAPGLAQGSAPAAPAPAPAAAQPQPGAARAAQAAAADEVAAMRSRAQALLADRDPEVRGEAALVLATIGTADAGVDPFDIALRVSKDPAEPARLRGIMALGVLGRPGVEVRLESLLLESAARPTLDAAAAALALGRLDDRHPGIAVETYLSRFQASSYRRHRDVLLALLVGLRGQEHPSKVRALQDLAEDEALKDSLLRRLLLEVLAETPHGLPADAVDEMLESRDPVDRAIGARLAIRAGAETPAAVLVRLERLASRDPHPDVRAAALEALTRARHLPALELAAHAATSPHPVEAAQGVRTAVTLGGGAMARALEGRILAERKVPLQVALMDALPGPWSDAYVDRCRELAADRRRPAGVRCQAALVLAAAGRTDAAPLLRNLFSSVEGEGALPQLAAAILAISAEPPPLDRFHRAGGALDPDRLHALMVAGHPDAGAALLEALDAPDADVAGLLRSWRRARGTALPSVDSASLPVPLRPLL